MISKKRKYAEVNFDNSSLHIKRRKLDTSTDMIDYLETLATYRL
jgi:hypothetical protein